MKIAIGLLAPQEPMSEEEPKGGLLAEPEINEEEYPISKESNDRMTKVLMETRHLGPADPAKPGKFWEQLADYWEIPVEMAKDHLCANCEYFDVSPAALKAMKVVPENAFDKSGGGRGYCHKYTFICHNLRVCDQWDAKEEGEED